MMLEGPVLIVILIGAIGFIIFATAIIKLHPFLSLLMATFGVGFIVRMPLMEIIDAVNRGFGGMMGTIGLIIIFGTIIGTVLEKSGGPSPWPMWSSAPPEKSDRPWPCPSSAPSPSP